MKRLYLTCFALAITLGISLAQDEYDALRYGRQYFGGSARVTGMAGSFGALGGDISSLSINPGGLGVFRSTEFSISPALSFDRTDATYLGSSMSDTRSQFTLGNMGYIGTSKTGKESGLVSVSYGFGYNQLNTFNRNTYMQARMPADNPQSSSYLDNFVNYANDAGPFDPDNLDPYYEQLAWYADLIYYDSLLLSYRNDINDVGYGQFQRQTIKEHGGLGEFAFGIGANYSDVFYMGVSFGIHELRFHQAISTFEEDDQDRSDYFNSFTFNEYLDAYGTGFTGKLGFIYRPLSFLRFGAAFHIPTFYRIREEFMTDISGTFDLESSTSENSPVNTFKYWLRTPYRAIGSVAFQVPKILTVNVDYELTDYSIMNFESNSPEDFADVNQSMRSIYKLTSNVRAGAEVVINPIYIRAGIGFYGSPYKDEIPGVNTYTLLYTGGLGIRTEKVFFDIAGVWRTDELKYQLYAEDANGANISGLRTNFIATVGFKF
jgi:hypothetical protein